MIEAWSEAQGGRYKPRSRRSYLLCLAAIEEYFAGVGITRPSQLDDDAVARWIATRQTVGTSNATINRALIAARVCFGWAAAREPRLCDETGFARAKDLREVGRVVHPIVPSPDEWRRCVAAMMTLPIDEQYSNASRAMERWATARRVAALLVASAVETGMRIDELRHQRAADVKDASVVIAAHDGWSPKSWQERTIPCAPTTAATLRALCKARDARPVGINGKAIALGDGWIAEYLDRAWAAATLPGRAPRMHDARRTFATASVRAGVGLDRVRVLLGHRDLSTTERYVGRYRTDVDAPVASLGVAELFDAAPADVIRIDRGRR